MTLSLQRLSCASCGAAVSKLIGQQSGVKHTTFHRGRAELEVDFDASLVRPAEILAAVRRGGYAAVIGKGHGSYAAPVRFDASMDIKIIAPGGQRVDLKRHVVLGKVTVFDFYAVWCGPCRGVARTLRRLLKGGADFAVRKINVVNWKKPVVKQHLSKVRALPYVLIHAADGRQVARLVGTQTQGLEKILRRLLSLPAGKAVQGVGASAEK